MKLSESAKKDLQLQILALIRNDMHDRDRPVILNIVRTAFIHDISELRGRSRVFTWCGLPADKWTKVQCAMMPDNLTRQLSAYECSGPAYEPYWEAAEDFAYDLLGLLQDEINLAAIMSANIDYGIDEGLRRACARLPIPFVALNRELAILKCHFDSNNSYYRSYKYRPRVDGVAVGSATARSELIDWGVLRPDQVEITGFPRFDPWIDRLRVPATSSERGAIVLLSFTHPDYNSGKAFGSTLATFAAASAQEWAVGTPFVVKCKDEADLELIEQALSLLPPHRLQLSIKSTFTETVNASAVVGYNSLAVVEALLSGAEILVPQWGGARTTEAEQAFWRENPVHCRHISFLESPERLTAALRRAAANDVREPDMTGRIALVQEFIDFRPDRYATDAVESFVARHVDRRRGVTGIRANQR